MYVYHISYHILYLSPQLICARNIVNADCETPPDTYVKCYIKDGERLRHKKKTRVVRHAAEPIYKQTIKYQVRLTMMQMASKSDNQIQFVFLLHCNAIKGGTSGQRRGASGCRAFIYMLPSNYAAQCKVNAICMQINSATSLTSSLSLSASFSLRAPMSLGGILSSWCGSVAWALSTTRDWVARR